MDRDFWWHIKAGQIMLQTCSLIHIEPFAYTRAGQPYLATHEWLAQIIFYLVYHFTGATGIILMRSALVTLMAFLLLSLDWKAVWPNALLVMWMGVLNCSEFTDRPQLFSYVLYTLFLVLAFRYLEEPPENRRGRRAILWTLVALEVIWVNLHGAACLMGFMILGSLILNDLGADRDLLWAMAGLGAGFFLSPNTYHNGTYLYRLLSDKTISLIVEWNPRTAGTYAWELGIFWLAAIAALGFTRRHTIFSAVVLALTGIAAARAYRYGIFFSASALAVAFYELAHHDRYQRFLQRFVSRKYVYPAIALCSMGALALAVHRCDTVALIQANQFGYGIDDRGREACDFLDRLPVSGPMFNNYDIGGYLIYREYSRRAVFVDGRNVDYGFDFLEKSLKAGFDPRDWRDLEDRYGFTCAVIDYEGIKPPVVLPFVVHLEKNPRWKLVYCDDWIAIYLKDVPGNRRLIAANGYRLLTPTMLEFDSSQMFRGLAPGDRASLEAELARAIGAAPASVKAKLVLAMHEVETGRPDAARELAESIAARRPALAEPFEIIGMAWAARGQWAQAGEAFEHSMELAKGSGRRINYGFLADIFSKAGDREKTDYYRRLAAEPL